MRLPNGYGSVVKLSGKRRNPYWVRLTDGWDDRGYPKYKTLGYVHTRSEGLSLLAKYHEDPWDDNKNMTLKELFTKWLEDRGSLLGERNRSGLKSQYKYVKGLENMKYRSIKAFMMQATINNCGKGYSTQSIIRNLWHHLDNYAYEIDLIDKKYSELLTSEQTVLPDRHPFTLEEIRKLWSCYYKGVKNIDIPLIFIYTGFRISEMQHIKIQNIDFNNWVLIGGMKTAAGRNRHVPIHSSIQSLVYNRAKNNRSGFLFENNGKMFSSWAFRKAFEDAMKSVNMTHIPHECRHTFETLLDEAGANRKCIDLMMGHASRDIGNRVYNHKTFEDLKQNIELLPTSDMLVTKEA